MNLETGRPAFFEEHRHCGDLDGEVQGEKVWMARLAAISDLPAARNVQHLR